MKNCELPSCFPVSLDDNKNYSSLFSKKTIENFSSTYTCPEHWIQGLEDAANGTCTLPFCTSPWDHPTVRTFKYSYGPNHGGYPLNRRSAADFCVDLGNGNDHSNVFTTNMSPTWPPGSPADAVAIAQADVNNKSQTASGYAGSASHAAAAAADTTTAALQRATTPPDQVLAAALANMNGGASSGAGATDTSGASGASGATTAPALYTTPPPTDAPKSTTAGTAATTAPDAPVSEELIKGVPNNFVYIGSVVVVLLVVLLLVIKINK